MPYGLPEEQALSSSRRQPIMGRAGKLSMPYKLIVVDASTKLGRFVPLANDAGRVQIRAHYSFVLIILSWQRSLLASCSTA